MLKLYCGREQATFCDAIPRRSFLQIGGLALGGLTLPRLLRAEAAAGRGQSDKSVIMIYLPGGPPHQDMFDLKMDAPLEIRGEFRPIPTKSGFEICELLPRLAARSDRYSIIRSVVGAKDRHESRQCLTGRLGVNPPAGGWPEMGAMLSKLRGPKHPSMPPFVGLSPKMQHRPYNNGYAGFLGPSHAAFQPNGSGRDDLILGQMSVERLDDRRQLLAGLDRVRRQTDMPAIMRGADAIQQQALGVLTSSRLADALDLEKEDPKIRARYGAGTAKVQGDAAPRLNQQFLMARRLVEAGARCVTLSYSFWDWHGSNFDHARKNLPDLDQALAALLDDLDERGLNDDVSVIVWGEFGRTPRINKTAGRDHWPNVSCALLAGGGMRTGQAIGSTDRLGGEADDRPVHFQEIFATLYHQLGLDPHNVTVRDLTGRPQYLVDGGYAPIAELV